MNATRVGHNYFVSMSLTGGEGLQYKDTPA
jgi:hypothetical protein